MLLPTHALTAQLVLSVWMVDLAKLTLKDVMPMVKDNLDKLNASNAHLAQLVKSFKVTNALPQDQVALASSSSTHWINAKLAHLVNWLILETTTV